MRLEIRKLRAACQDYESKKQELVTRLVGAEAELSELVYSLRQRYDLMLAARRNPIGDDVNAFLAYARNVALTSSAPFGWNPSLPLRLSRPPNPQEDMMRNSLLYQKMIPTSNNTGTAAADGANSNVNDTTITTAAANKMNDLMEESSDKEEFDIFDLS